MVQDVGMLYSPRVTSREVIITFYQRTLLGTSANQKRHYLKSYNNNKYYISHPSIIAHCVLISDVSLKIGAVTKMKYLVTEVHFKNPVKGTCKKILFLQNII